MALVGLDYLKTYLGITTTAGDAQLQTWIDQASALIVEYCGRDFLSRSYPGANDDGAGDNGIYAGDGSRFLFLRQRPVTAITSVYLDNSAEYGTNPNQTNWASTTLLTEGTDFVVHWDSCLPGTTTKASKCGILERVGTVWTGGTLYSPGKLVAQAIPARGNIKVAYTAGYTTIPHSVRNATCQLVALIRRTFDKGGPVTSESLGGYSYSLGAGSGANSFPEFGSIRAALAPWKEITI